MRAYWSVWILIGDEILKSEKKNISLHDFISSYRGHFHEIQKITQMSKHDLYWKIIEPNSRVKTERWIK